MCVQRQLNKNILFEREIEVGKKRLKTQNYLALVKREENKLLSDRPRLYVFTRRGLNLLFDSQFKRGNRPLNLQC